MTDEEIEKKAKVYRESRKDLQYFSEPYKKKIEKAYIAGAKENTVIWHDLRKNQKDLPEGYAVVLNQHGERVMYDYKHNVWRNYDADNYICADEVIAWCEIPRFEVEADSGVENA